MPTYKVKPEENYPMEATAPSKKNEKRYPRVYIQGSPEIIAALEVGQQATVTLTGTVRGLESRQTDSPNGNRCEFQLELRTVDAEPVDGADDGEEQEPTMLDAINEKLGYKKK